MPPVIGLIGAMGSGKSTAAQILVDEYGYTRVRMAGMLKTMLSAAGLSAAQLDGDQKEVPTPLLCGKTPRHAMQTLGTEWGRKCIDDDLWVMLTEASIQKILAEGQKVVIDDLRFENETRMIGRLNGTSYRVRRSSVEDVAVTHVSEALWRELPSNGEINNDGDIDNLKLELKGLLNG